MTQQPLIVFDGVCNYCNSTVNRIIKNDIENQFKFTPLQSEFGKKLFEKYSIDARIMDSIVLFEGSQFYSKSEAIALIAKRLGGRYYILYLLLKITPLFISNACYDFFARNRYKWFGKKDICMLPTEDVKQKFIM